MTYEPKQFNLPTLDGLSDEQIKVHLGLYEGYVKHVNLIAKTLRDAREGKLDLDPYIANELRRRYAFEFDGMRMHEYYFDQFVGGAKELTVASPLDEAAREKYGDGRLEAHMKQVATTRGIGWVVAYCDGAAGELQTVFVSDHELGQLAGLSVILALDMWEHAYMVDYRPAAKKDYVDAFFTNVNWGVAEERFNRAVA